MIDPMNCLGRAIALALLASLAPGLRAADASAKKAPVAKPLAGKSVRVSISEHDLDDTRRWREVRQLIDEAVDAGISHLVLDLNVSGGRAKTALPVAEELARLKVHTVAYVNPSAVAGGALVALACDEIWMAPGSRIGAASPAVEMDENLSKASQETLLAQSLALLKSGARGLARLKGHREDVAEAFVDKDVELKMGDEVISAKGELLMLDEKQAARVVEGSVLLAKGQAATLVDLANSAKLGSEAALLTTDLLASLGAEEKPASPAPAKPSVATPARHGDYSGKVVVIPVGEDDLIAPARFEFMTRTLERCNEEGAEAVIFDLDTPGGLAWDTANLMMKDLQRLRARSLAFVNPRALSAGAMIAVATDAIYMAPASSMGAATPIYGNGQEMGEAERAKMNSAIMSMARTVAKEKGHDWRVVEAMIDKDRELIINGEVLCAKGDILTLDAEQAVMISDGRPLIAKSIVKSIDDIKRAEGLKGATVTAEPTGFEQIAIWVTKYAAILILIGIAGAYLEMQTPGFGLPGFIAIAAFGLFFFGHYVAGSLVGKETMVAAAVFILGIVLLVTEFFLLPGTILPGILGFLCIMGALVYTMSGWDVSVPVSVPVGPGLPEAAPVATGVPFNLSAYAAGLRNFAIGITGAAVLIFLMIRWLPELRPFRQMVLSSAAGGTLKETPSMQAVGAVAVGSEGIARSALRPYGTVEIDGRQVEAMSEGDYIQSGSRVKIREVRGVKIIVEPVV